MSYLQIWLLLWQSLFSQSIPFPGPGRASTASSSIAYDTSVDGGIVNTATTLSWSHTTSGSNRILFVTVTGTSTETDITGVTYNSVSMTKLTSVKGTADRYVYIYYLAAPATGTNTVTVSAGSSIIMFAHSVSYTGAKQTGIPDASGTSTPAAEFQPTTSLTTTVNNCWMLIYGRNGGSDPTAGTGSTLRQSSHGSGTFDTNGPVSTGSNSMQIQDGFGGWAIIILSFAPA